MWRYYSSKGNRVAVLGRRENLLNEQLKSNPENTKVYVADITQTEETFHTLLQVYTDLTFVDLAIVCAGTGDINDELLLDKEMPAIKTNVEGWTSVVNSLCHQFQTQGRGHLVTITSIGGLTGEKSAPAYSATKAYQINYTQALRKKYKGSEIIVTEIRPGLVDTAMAKGEGLFWLMPPEKVAYQIVMAIKKKKKIAVVTKRWRIVSFLLKYFC